MAVVPVEDALATEAPWRLSQGVAALLPEQARLAVDAAKPSVESTGHLPIELLLLLFAWRLNGASLNGSAASRTRDFAQPQARDRKNHAFTQRIQRPADIEHKLF
jgi:hypothetical protein